MYTCQSPVFSNQAFLDIPHEQVFAHLWAFFQGGVLADAILLPGSDQH